MTDNPTNGGDTLGVETGQTIAQSRATGVAAEIRRLGEEAFRLGEHIRNNAERFAQEEIRAVQDMESFLKKGLARLRHIETTMKTARTVHTEQGPVAEPQALANHSTEEHQPNADRRDHADTD